RAEIEPEGDLRLGSAWPDRVATADRRDGREEGLDGRALGLEGAAAGDGAERRRATAQRRGQAHPGCGARRGRLQRPLAVAARIRRRPEPGTSLRRVSPVRINVSSGPNPKPAKAVPDVTGEDEATATSDLQAAGFRVSVVDQPTSDQNQDGVVLDEDPAAGTRAPAGSLVTIYVGRFS